MAVECLQSLGAEEFTIDIGQVEFFRGVMAELPLSPDQAQLVQCAIGRKDNATLTELVCGLNLDDEAKAALLALPRLFGGPEVLQRAEQAVTNDRSRQALDNLRQVMKVLEVYGVEKHITFDLGELRGVDSHTGITFQGFLGGLGQAVCSGGRYDDLTARYGLPAPATGFAFNLLHLLSAFDKQLEQGAAQYADVLIFQSGHNKQPAQRAAQALRQQGYAVARDIIERQLEDSIQYAHKMNYRFVMVVDGPDDTVRLIRLADGMEQQIPYRSLLTEGFCL
ncbi:MAG: ATP phosphoribosyltransferase regulatory subunit [Syntrophotaleaceae bacterium]